MFEDENRSWAGTKSRLFLTFRSFLLTVRFKPTILLSMNNNNFTGGFRNYDEYDEDFDDEFDEDFDDTFEEDFDEDFNNADFNRDDDDDEDLDEATQLARFGQFLVDDEEEEKDEPEPYVRDEEDEADLLNPTGMKLDKKRDKKTEKKTAKKADKKSEKKADKKETNVFSASSVEDFPEDDEALEEDSSDFDEGLIEDDGYSDYDY